MFVILSRLVLSVIIAVGLPLFYLLLSPIYLIRYIIAKSVQHLSPKSGKILSAQSTSSGGVDDFSKPLWTLTILFVVRGKSGFEEFKQRFLNRVVLAKNEAGVLRMPELQQYVVPRFGFLFWEWEEEFRIEEHVHQNTGDFTYDVLDENTAQNLMQSLVYKPYTPGKSPWEILFLENYQDGNPEEDGEPKSIIVARFHHSVGDGFSLVKLWDIDFGESTEFKSVVSRTKEVPPRRLTVGQRFQRIFLPLYMFFRLPYDLASIAVDIARFNENPWHIPEAQLTRTVNGAFMSSIPIQTIKELKDLCGSSFVSVLLAAYAGALRKFMKAAGYDKVPSNVLCGMPMPVPNHPDNKLRNHVSAAVVRLSMDLPTPLQRLRAMEKYQIASKTSTLPITFHYSGILTGLLFAWMVKFMTKNVNVTAICSIFPAPATLMRGGGFTFVDFACGGGLTPGNVGMGFTCLSYNSKLTIGVAIDEGLVPKLTLPATKLMEYMIEEFQELRLEAESERNLLKSKAYKFNEELV